MTEELKDLAHSRRQDEVQERLTKGNLETKDGSRIYPSRDGSRFNVLPRTVADKVNYSYLIQKAIDNCLFCIQYSYEAYARATIALLNCMPNQETDEEFKEEVKNATFKVLIPTGKYGGFGGQTYEITKEAMEYDHFAIFRACINLLRRRGLYTIPQLWNSTRNEVFFTEGK